MEETSFDVKVGQLALVYEYVPDLDPNNYENLPHAVTFIFESTIIRSSEPCLPGKPDKFQTAVKWVKLRELNAIILAPDIRKQIIHYIESDMNQTLFIEEHLLQPIRKST